MNTSIKQNKIKKDLSEAGPPLYRFMRPIVTFAMFKIYNLQTENSDVIPEEGPVVLAGNHKFYFDPLCVDVCSKRCIYALCWETYYYNYEWFFKNIGSIPVIGGKGKLALAAAIEHLKKGNIINLFPEGKINRTDELLLPFKRGAVTMAQEANCKIIPFSITGDYKFRSKNLKITFGDPIDVSNLEFEQANQLLYDNVKQLMIKNIQH